MQYAYKVVRMRVEDNLPKYYSAFVRDSFLELEYSMDRDTFPAIRNSLILVFKKYSYTLHFVSNNMTCLDPGESFCVFLCRCSDTLMPVYDLCFHFEEDKMKEFWTKGPNPLGDSAPRGTYGTKSLRLIDLISTHPF